MSKRDNTLRYAVALLLAAILIAMGSAAVASDSFFSRLEITQIAVKGHKLHIRGMTDLPRGSVLNFKVGIPGFEGKHGKPNRIKVHVNSHRFFVQIDLPKKWKKKGPRHLRLDLLFSPQNQSKKVKKAVGARGERLKGPKMKKENGGRHLMESRTISI